MKTNETYKKLSKVAKENGFYLCPEKQEDQNVQT